MSTAMIWEMIGYLGSILVLISLLMSSVIKLRWINMIGSFIFCVYALAIQSYPTALMNGCLVFINIYYLYKLTHTKKSFLLVETAPQDASVKHFIETSMEDIRKYFPEFHYEQDTANKVFFIYQDMTIAGLFLGNADENGNFEIALDYTTPQYRDCSVGKYVYEQLAELSFKKLIYAGKNAIHEAYVSKMGFSKENDQYVKML